MIAVGDTATETKRSLPAPVESREETVRIGRAQLTAAQAGKLLEASGVSLASIAKLSKTLPGEFSHLTSSMTPNQSVLLRNYLKALLDLAEASGGGEVELGSISNDRLKLTAKNSGLVSFLFDLIEVVVSFKNYEACIEASNNTKISAGLKFARELEAKFEQHADEMACQFVA